RQRRAVRGIVGRAAGIPRRGGAVVGSAVAGQWGRARRTSRGPLSRRTAKARLRRQVLADRGFARATASLSPTRRRPARLRLAQVGSERRSLRVSRSFHRTL